MSPRVYLDHAATTPVLPEAQAAMADALTRCGNPSSPHADGRAARAELEKARATIADVLGWRHDVIFTSGASEAIALVASRAKAEARWVGATEHDAVVAAMGADAVAIPVDAGGIAQPAEPEKPTVIAMQQVNNETGVIQPLELWGQARASGSLLFADCAQSAGKLPLPDADFIAISGHKLGAPLGVGALLVRDVATLAPSGGQEKGYRRGTENVPAAAALAAALEGRAFEQAMPRLSALRASLDADVKAAGGVVIAENSPRMAPIAAYAMPGVSGASQLVQFDLAGIAVSAGSACASGSMKASSVLAAMGMPPEIGGCFVRVSFGPQTSEQEVERFLAEWRRIARSAGTRAA